MQKCVHCKSDPVSTSGVWCHMLVGNLISVCEGFGEHEEHWEEEGEHLAAPVHFAAVVRAGPKKGCVAQSLCPLRGATWWGALRTVFGRARAGRRVGSDHGSAKAVRQQLVILTTLCRFTRH